MSRHRSAVLVYGRLIVAAVGSFLLPAIALSPLSAQDRAQVARAVQAIRGHAIDHASGTPVPTAAITLIRGEERLVTTYADEEGYFFLPVPVPGEYRLEGRRIGYATTLSQGITVVSTDTVTVEFRMLPDAVPLEPIVVTGHTNRGIWSFLDHMDNWGKGVFLTPVMVDSIAPWHWAAVFRGQEEIWVSWEWAPLPRFEGTDARGLQPRVRTFLGEGCMNYMVDHTPITGQNSYILDALDPDDIVAVEIYRSSGEIPPGLQSYGASSSVRGEAGALSSTPSGAGVTYQIPQFFQCGVTVFWTGAGW